MTLYKHLEGFDHWASYLDGNGDGWSFPSFMTFPAGRYGGQSIKDPGGNGSGGTLTLPSNQTTLYVGAAFYADSWGATNQNIITFLSSGTIVGKLQLNGVSNLQYIDSTGGTTSFARGTIANNTWSYFEIGIIADASAAPGNVVVRQDNSTIASLTVATSISGSVYFDHVGIFTPYAGADGRIDDVYLYNNQGLDVEFCGPLQVFTAFPTGDISNTGSWAPTSGTTLYNMVNEVQEDGATTTITSPVDGSTAMFSYTTLPGTLGTIIGVQASTNGTSVGGSIAPRISSDGTVEVGSSVALGASYTAHSSTTMELDPGTGLRWSISGFNTATKGIIKGSP